MLVPSLRAAKSSGTSCTRSPGTQTRISRRILNPTGRNSMPSMTRRRQRKKPLSGSLLARASLKSARATALAARLTTRRPVPASPWRLAPRM